MQRSNLSSISFFILSTFIVFLIGFTAHAQEPAYCNPSQFRQFEIANPIRGLERAHVYRLGNITVAGLGVGNSNANDVKRLAEAFSSTTGNEGYCTWYFNKGNKAAEQMFIHEYVSKPGSGFLGFGGKSPSKDAQEYISKLGAHFDGNAVSFVSCAETRGYVAMGCDGMRHRGPSVFGMFLAYSGCSPKNADAIVNKVWGLNGVPDKNRLAIIQKGYDLGRAHPAQSSRLRAQFLGQAQ